MLPKLPAPPGTPACVGRSDEWESVDVAIRERARQECLTCPVLGWCGEQARRAQKEGLELEGVWGGVSYA